MERVNTNWLWLPLPTALIDFPTHMAVLLYSMSPFNHPHLLVLHACRLHLRSLSAVHLHPAFIIINQQAAFPTHFIVYFQLQGQNVSMFCTRQLLWLFYQSKQHPFKAYGTL